MRVVIIDDSEVALELAAGALRLAGMQVPTLDSPIGSSVAIMSVHPDLVLIDVTMPALSGEKVVEILKRMRSLAGVKIVLHSDQEPAELAAAVKRCGADGYICKTKDRERLVADVLRFAKA